MSRLRTALATFLAVVALALAAAGFAGAASLARGLNGVSLAPSDTPSLLGPIAESGRVGWACKPEQAAAAKRARAAELPTAQAK